MSRLSNLWQRGERIASADRVRAERHLERVEAELREAAAEARRALSAEARKVRARARRSGYAAGYRAGLRQAALAFGAEHQRWQALEARLGEALDAAVRSMAAELPEAALLRSQLGKCLATVKDAVRLKVHANAVTAVRLAELWAACGYEAPAIDVVVADYLRDGQFVMETETNIIEGSIKHEIAAFCAGLREAAGTP
jgi:flagellar biosynthesis/type III secretory pathway protein FliH